MGWTALPLSLPVIWAQATGSTASNPSTLAPLALRRWCASLTLCSPESIPSFFGLWSWLAALGGLLILAVLFQGPSRALGQVFDVAGNARLVASATKRLRRSGRMVAATIGLTVISWTGSQSLNYSKPEGRDDLVLLTKARGLGELAVEQGILAGLTPLRDVAGLATNLVLLSIATLLVFRSSADRWDSVIPPGVSRKRVSPWAVLAGAAGIVIVCYRIYALAFVNSELPQAVFLMVEALIFPAAMAVCDGLLLGWVLVELRNAGHDDPPGDLLDTAGAVGLLPASTLACLLTLPARYLVTAILIASYYMPTSVAASPIGTWLRWQLKWGLTELQAAALLAAGLTGAVAWSGGSPSEAVRGYARMLASQGGRLVVVVALAGLAAFAFSAVAYLVILSLPSASWVLNAADSYAHYATLPVGLWALSALVELAERSLPEATLIPVKEPQDSPT